MNNLAKRVIVGTIGIPLAIAIMYLGGILFTAVLAVISSVALWEFYSLVRNKGTRPLTGLGIIWNIVLLVAVTLIANVRGLDSLTWLFIFTALVFLAPLSILALGLLSRNDDPIHSISSTVLGLFYITPAFLSLEYMRNGKCGSLWESTANWDGFVVVLALFVSVWVCDSAAYFVGTKFGKHKILPKVSPNKSWQGAIAGGLAGAIAFVWILTGSMEGVNMIHAVAIGIIVGVVGQYGDFVESMFKRDAMVKDSSNILPGHGGVLDRFDSMMFVSTATMIYLLIVDSVKALMENH
jgi:phosphatidate cytidylyltransferase